MRRWHFCTDDVRRATNDPGARKNCRTRDASCALKSGGTIARAPRCARHRHRLHSPGAIAARAGTGRTTIGRTRFAMLHHVSLGTNDIARARVFYDAVLGVIGLRFLDAAFGLN